MASVHMTLQGKGGSGKSISAALLAMNKLSKGEAPFCIDADPLNPTFSDYKALKVKHLPIMEDDEINPRNFDQIIEWIVESGECDVIIDNGAPAFIQLSSYLISQDIPSLLLNELKKQLVIHISVVGGQAHEYTKSGFKAVVEQFPPETRFAVWLNPYWGTVESGDGVPFEKSEEYLANKEKVGAIIYLPQLKNELHGQDFSDMLEQNKTFDEAIADKKISIMSKQRLKQVKKLIFDQLNTFTVI